MTGGKVDGRAWNKSRRVMTVDAWDEETVEESELVGRWGVLSRDRRKGGDEAGDDDENGHEEHLESGHGHGVDAGREMPEQDAGRRLKVR